MRMSEFEKEDNEKGKELLPLKNCGSALPDDFTEEELFFARELHTLFAPEEESLPPYYVQTLLDGDDQRFEPAVRGFEYKTNARVFRRLKLRRHLFGAPPSWLRALRVSMGDVSLRRSALAMVGTFLLIMLLTVAFTGSSFASGVSILLHGTHLSGVYVTNKYPLGVVHPPHSPQGGASRPERKQISLLTVQQQLQFPIYWPTYSLPGYSLLHINFYTGLDQQWADGPMLEFVFGLSSTTDMKGSGEVWVREFLPRTDVLQVVDTGASAEIAPDANGVQAIYVNGEWNSDTSNGPVWEYGGRSELIYEINGVIFWIAGDQRDGIKEAQLLQVAQGLARYSSMPRLRLIVGDSSHVTQLTNDSSGPFSTDVIIIFASDSNEGDGPYFLTVTSSQPPKNAH